MVKEYFLMIFQHLKLGELTQVVGFGSLEIIEVSTLDLLFV